MRCRAAVSGAGIAGLTVGLIIGGVITYGLAAAIPLGKPYTITTTAASVIGSPLASSKIVYVSLLPGAGENKSRNGYYPDTTVVVLGVNSTVVWANNDGVVHTVSPLIVPAGANWSAGSGNLNPGQAYLHTFTTPGTYSYRCAYHSWMQGKIIVKSTSGS